MTLLDTTYIGTSCSPWQESTDEIPFQISWILKLLSEKEVFNSVINFYLPQNMFYLYHIPRTTCET